MVALPCRRVFITILAAVGLLLAACAPAAQPTATPPRATATAQVVPSPTRVLPTPTPSPKYGGTLRFSQGDEPNSWDPHTTPTTSYIGWAVAGNGLLKLAPETFLPAPDLAERWTQTNDTTFDFYLRQGIKLQNLPPLNGREFTADDVLYSFQRLTTNAPQFSRKGLFTLVKAITKVDKYTVRFELQQPFAPFLTYVGDRFNIMVVKEMVDKCGGDLNPPECSAGTGPFIFKEHTRGVGGYAVKNPDYFLKGLPYIDRLEWQIIGDRAASVAAMATGKTDIITGLTLVDKQTLEKTGSKGIVYGVTAGSSCVAHVPMIVTKQPFNDIRVRKAINLAIDRQEVIDAAFQGAALMSGPISPKLPFFALPDDELRSLPGYRQPKAADIAEAKRLLTEAGYPNGFSATFELSEGFPSINKWPGEVVINQLQKNLGLKLTVQVQEISAFLDNDVKKNFDLRTRCTGAGVEPDEFTFNNFHTKGARNYTNFSDPDIDRLIEQARTTYDPKERQRLYREVQRMAIDKVAKIWLHDSVGWYAWYPYVTGFRADTFQFQRDLGVVWLNK